MLIVLNVCVTITVSMEEWPLPGIDATVPVWLTLDGTESTARLALLL